MASAVVRVESLIDKCRSEANLPKVPEVTLRLVNALQSEEPNFVEIERLVTADPGMTATVIRLACSAFFGQGQTYTTVRAALNVLGLKELDRIVTTEWMQSVACNSKSAPAFNRFRFSYHGLFTGFMAASVLKRAKQTHPGQTATEPDQIFLVGLLHDVSVGLLASVEPNVCNQMITSAKASGKSVGEVFMDTYDCKIEMLGSTATQTWKMPQLFQDAMWYSGMGHRHPGDPIAYACVDYANWVAEHHEAGIHEWSFECEIDKKLHPVIGLPEEEMAEAVEAAHRSTRDYLAAAGIAG